MATQAKTMNDSITSSNFEKRCNTSLHRLSHSVCVFLLCFCATSLSKADQTTDPGTLQPKSLAKPQPSKQRDRFPIPEDVNGYKTVISPARFERPVRFAIYQGKGSNEDGIENVINCFSGVANTSFAKLSGEDFRTLDLNQYAAVIFSGGVASAQSEGLGESGRSRVRDYVRSGGGYVGICAGAYLACSNFSWGLGVLNASTVSSKWRRGQAWVKERLNGAGAEILGDTSSPFFVRYNNGPILKPAGREDIPEYVPIALFETEVAENDTPAGLMVHSPAQIVAHFGQGRVFISSPHPENTPGLVHLIPRALSWVASGKGAALKNGTAEQE